MDKKKDIKEEKVERVRKKSLEIFYSGIESIIPERKEFEFVYWGDSLEQRKKAKKKRSMKDEFIKE